MTISKAVGVGLLSLSLVAPAADAATRHHSRSNDTQVVDVNAHVIPPGPPHAAHVIVVNSAQNAPRHHGLLGMFQRLHQWHMRQRAKLYRSLFVR
jgi:hypothetical protein